MIGVRKMVPMATQLGSFSDALPDGPLHDQMLADLTSACRGQH